VRAVDLAAKSADSASTPIFAAASEPPVSEDEQAVTSHILSLSELHFQDYNGI
jgi:hypothetical protein